MIRETAIIVIVFVILLVVTFDLYPIIKRWVLRIHIGRYQDQQSWNKSIINKATVWINHTPKIKVTDNSRLVVIDILKGNYTKSAIQHWQEASLLLGLAEYIKSQEDSKIKDKITIYLNSKFTSDGQWAQKPEHIDCAILAYSIFKLPFIEVEKYKPALDYTWELIKQHIGNDGTVGYRKSMMNYRYVDTIGFICPFLINYGVYFNSEESIELAIKQIKEYEQNGMLNGFHIPSHVYKVEKKLPLGLIGWGRGLGWFAIGVVDSWLDLPISHKYKSTLEESVKKVAIAAMNFQQENGSWNWTITRNEARADSSTTAMLAWLLINASEINEIGERSYRSSEKAIQYLMSVTRRDGAVEFSQGDTKDIGVYSNSYEVLPFTQGFCIRNINSYNRLLNKLKLTS